MNRDQDRDRDRNWSSRSKRRRRDHEYWVFGGILSRVSSAMALDAPYLLKLLLRDILDLFVCQLDQLVSDSKLTCSKLIAPSAELFAHSIIFSLLLCNESLNGTEGTNSIKVVNGGLLSNAIYTMVRHFWERNNIKGAIDATRKLPDHSVGTSRPDQYSHEENGDSHLRFFYCLGLHKRLNSSRHHVHWLASKSDSIS
ncbi:hypothetical protein CsSME_00011127 [Camellia sinensis var. sinensis]